MKNQSPPQTPSPQAPVYLPMVMIVLALSTILSTLLPPEIQQYSAMGVPLILCFWLSISLISVLLIVLVAWRIIRAEGNDD